MEAMFSNISTGITIKTPNFKTLNKHVHPRLIREVVITNFTNRAKGFPLFSFDFTFPSSHNCLGFLISLSCSFFNVSYLFWVTIATLLGFC